MDVGEYHTSKDILGELEKKKPDSDMDLEKNPNLEPTRE